VSGCRSRTWRSEGLYSDVQSGNGSLALDNGVRLHEFARTGPDWCVKSPAKQYGIVSEAGYACMAFGEIAQSSQRCAVFSEEALVVGATDLKETAVGQGIQFFLQLRKREIPTEHLLPPEDAFDVEGAPFSLPRNDWLVLRQVKSTSVADQGAGIRPCDRA
jgi:hypothetical protein